VQNQNGQSNVSTNIIGDTVSGGFFIYNSGITGSLAPLQLITAGGGMNRTNAYYAPWGNAFTLGWVMDTTDRVILNAIEYPTAYFSTNGSSAGTFTSGNLLLCGGTPFAGTLYRVSVYSSVLTPQLEAQWNQATVLANTAVAVPPAIGNTAQVNELTSAGDSILHGNGSGINLLTAITLNSTFGIQNNGIGGTFAKNWQNDMPVLLPQISLGGYLSAFVNWDGTNDMGAGDTAQNVVSYFQNICRQVHAYNLSTKCLIGSMIDRTSGGTDAEKNSLDTLLRANWRQVGIDALVDVAADPNLGADGAANNTTYFVDKIHPNTFAAWNDQNPIWQRAINRMFGHRDFSSATTYTSGAGAATSISAESESGSTATYTTTLNPPVGSTVSVTGNTGAATNYNTLYPGCTVQTTSASNFTCILSVTGLGGAAGSPVAAVPLQKDADVVTILGGSSSSQNFTLESALGYTGQQIWFINTNTNSWTIIPWLTETINGASSYTLTSGSILCLESTIVSSAAAGANWLSAPCRL
jgi:hypothetical protein